MILSCLQGNIRVYCRIRPFLPGQSQKQSTIEYVGENGDLVIANPSKPRKDSRKLFKFNKVFGPAATQGTYFLILSNEHCCHRWCMLSNKLFILIYVNRGGICGHPTIDSFCPWWIQCLYICLWSNWFREDLHNGMKFLYFSNQPSTSCYLCLTICFWLPLEWAQCIINRGMGCQLSSPEWPFPNISEQEKLCRIWNWCSNGWDIQWTSTWFTLKW